jgi:hypothetical protein
MVEIPDKEYQKLQFRLKECNQRRTRYWLKRLFQKSGSLGDEK